MPSSIYLDHELVLFAADDGFDLVAAFHAAGRRVDAYTIQRADAAGLAAARRLLALEVDQITTDDPEGLAAALRLTDGPLPASSMMHCKMRQHRRAHLIAQLALLETEARPLSCTLGSFRGASLSFSIR